MWQMGRKYTKIYWNGFWNIKFDILQRHFVCPLKGYENICIHLKYERCVKLDAAMKLQLHSNWSVTDLQRNFYILISIARKIE